MCALSFDANGHWYAYAADPLVLLVNQERLNEKRFCVLNEWTDLLTDGLRGRYVILTPHLRIRVKKFNRSFSQYGLTRRSNYPKFAENVDAFSESKSFI